MSNNDTKTNLKANHGAHNRTQPHKRGLLLSFIIFMAWVAGIGLLLSLVACQPVNAKQIATDDSSGYYINLSKISSGQASRHTLAFFVSNICLASQAKHDSSTAPIYLSQGKTVYDGVTSQNKIANRRICGAVSTDTESEPRHPILLPYSVALTQKTVGGYHA
ncbi:hypothetical protein ACQKDP_07625 [Psychrobacter pacificensis]|uniref:hypothetical protein n=1 Tax=Psychrobacter pacificensis TaxID=112002 RepID=UPI003D07A996